MFQNENPKGLLGAIEFGGAATLLVQNMVDVLESMVEDSRNFPV